MVELFTPIEINSDPQVMGERYAQAVRDHAESIIPPERVASREEVKIDGVWMRIHRPRTNAFGTPPGLVIFLRGGYGVLGDRDSHDAFARRYVDLPAVVISVDLDPAQSDFDQLVAMALGAVKHADNTPLMHTTLTPEVVFVGVDAYASVALAAAMTLAKDPTLEGSLSTPWTGKGVHLVDPLVDGEMVASDDAPGLLSGDAIVSLITSWPAQAGAQAFMDGLEEVLTPVLVTVSSLWPGAMAAEDIYNQLEALAPDRVVGMSVNLCGVEAALITRVHLPSRAGIAGMIQAFKALAALPSDAVAA